MQEIPVEIIIGHSFGLVIGLICGLVVGTVAFVHSYVRGQTFRAIVPISISLVIGLGIASVTNVITITGIHTYPWQFRILIISLIVIVIGMYAGAHGERLASELSRDTTVPVRSAKSLSADAFDSIDATGHVTIRSSGPVQSMDGYPTLSPSIRRSLETGEWRFPADLSLSTLETRLETRLQSEYDFRHVSVEVDSRGLATIAVAPTSRTISTQLPTGIRAVSLWTALPTGLAPGDTVDVIGTSRIITGEVIDICESPTSYTTQSDDERWDYPAHNRRTTASQPRREQFVPDSFDRNQEHTAPKSTQSLKPNTVSVPSENGGTSTPSAQNRSVTAGTEQRPIVKENGSVTATDGGYGQVTLAVSTADAGTVLPLTDGQLAVHPSDSSPAFDAIVLLERAGKTIQKVPGELVNQLESTVDSKAEFGANELKNCYDGNSTDDFEDCHILAATVPSNDGTNERTWIFEPTIDELEQATAAFIASDRPLTSDCPGEIDLNSGSEERR